MHLPQSILLTTSGAFVLAVPTPVAQDNGVTIPSSFPPDSWQTAQCTTPEVVDASIDQNERWDSVGTKDGRPFWMTGKRMAGMA